MTILGQKLTSEPVLWSRVYRVLMSPLWVKSPLVGLITRLPSFKLPELRVRKGSFHKKPGDLLFFSFFLFFIVVDFVIH